MPRAGNRPGAEGGPAAPVITAEDDDNLEEYITHFEDANEKGHVLNALIFGGQILGDDSKGPSYMLGTFRDGTASTGHSLIRCADVGQISSI